MPLVDKRLSQNMGTGGDKVQWARGSLKKWGVPRKE